MLGDVHLGYQRAVYFYFYSERTTNSTSMFLDGCGVPPRQGYFCGDVRGVIDALYASSRTNFLRPQSGISILPLEISPKGYGKDFFLQCPMAAVHSASQRDSCTVPRVTVCTHDPSFDGATGVSPKSVCQRSLSYHTGYGNRRYGTTWYSGPRLAR